VKTSEKLAAALELFEDGANWNRGLLFNSYTGKYCAIGVVNKVRYGYPEGRPDSTPIPTLEWPVDGGVVIAPLRYTAAFAYSPEIRFLHQALVETVPPETLAQYEDLPAMAVAEYNDSHTYADVHGLFTRAIALAQQEEEANDNS
jgi:hypothetical protein